MCMKTMHHNFYIEKAILVKYKTRGHFKWDHNGIQSCVILYAVQGVSSLKEFS